jgi:hypothetical protein
VLVPAMCLTTAEAALIRPGVHPIVHSSVGTLLQMVDHGCQIANAG